MQPKPPKSSLYTNLKGLMVLGRPAREKVTLSKANSSSFFGHMEDYLAMLDEGHCIASCPCGAHKQILHSINLHLFAHLCCQQHLSREVAAMQGKEHGLWGGPTWVYPALLLLAD